MYILFTEKLFILKMPLIKIILLGIGFEERKQYNIIRSKGQNQQQSQLRKKMISQCLNHEPGTRLLLVGVQKNWPAKQAQQGTPFSLKFLVHFAYFWALAQLIIHDFIPLKSLVSGYSTTHQLTITNSASTQNKLTRNFITTCKNSQKKFKVH